MTTSSSVVSVPLYQTCNDVDVSCQVVGFMQLFIDDVNGDTIHTHILNIAIPSSDDAKDEPTVGGGSSLIPIRLIQKNP